MSQKFLSISVSIYRQLLKAYPTVFRQVYGPAMVQLFRDCGRDACRQNGAAGLVRVWL